MLLHYCGDRFFEITLLEASLRNGHSLIALFKAFRTKNMLQLLHRFYLVNQLQ